MAGITNPRPAATVVPATLVLEGGSPTAEATTTSTSAVDLITVSSLAIAPETVVLGEVNFRKTGGAAVQGGIGLKLNATVVAEATTSAARIAATTALDQVQIGHARFTLGPRVTNYLKAATGHYSVFNLFGGTLPSQGSFPAISSNMPSVTITDVILRAISGNALVTVGASLLVYSMITS